MSRFLAVSRRQEKAPTRKEEIMQVFVTGATGPLGRHLPPGLVDGGHAVTAITRTSGKVARLRETGSDGGRAGCCGVPQMSCESSGR